MKYIVDKNLLFQKNVHCMRMTWHASPLCARLYIIDGLGIKLGIILQNFFWVVFCITLCLFVNTPCRFLTTFYLSMINLVMAQGNGRNWLFSYNEGQYLPLPPPFHLVVSEFLHIDFCLAKK